MERNNLLQLIQKTERENKRKTIKRFAFTGLAYYVFFTLAACIQTGFAPLEVVTNAFLCLIIAPCMTFLSALVFRTLYDAAASEKYQLEQLYKELSTMDKNKI